MDCAYWALPNGNQEPAHGAVRTDTGAVNTSAHQCCSPSAQGPELVVLTVTQLAKDGWLTRCNFTIALRFAAWHVSRLSVSLCRKRKDERQGI